MSLVPSLVLEAHAAALLAEAAAAFLAGAAVAEVEAVVAMEAEAGQDEVQHLLAAEACRGQTHPGCPQQTFAALMMPALAYQMEQHL